MMANKLKLKRYMIISIVVFAAMLGAFIGINIYEYHVYNANYNKKISAVIASVREKYPEVSDKELIDILNGDLQDDGFLAKYGIDMKDESAILDNNVAYHRFLALNIIYITVFGATLILVFLIFNARKDKEIKGITGYIEEINRKNYTLHIDEISEDELSILKNEIYKTTVMLKESADNSLNDKKNLKKSLEDISHQLKTPLTSILVILDNLIDEPDMDEAVRQDFIRDIKRETININFLVQAILKLSKFDADTIKFIKEERLIKDIVDKASKNVSTLCDLKNINLNIEGDDEAKINCDFRWQTEAVTNILKNCIEHSYNDGALDISYSTNQVYSIITIKDYGSGISEEDLPHIFERFYKGENSSKDSIGIGLALAKTIIEEDNGSIDVKSDKNGTEFIIKYFKI
ncbi:MAG: HAMP domain-containing histidine kinase [Lachnospiraceae bacterium]|nr:HAMP domain-containing histidine kinase [Lachnospiraceae bacterium]